MFRHDPVAVPLAIEVALDYWQSLPKEQSGNDERRFVGAPLLIPPQNSIRKIAKSSTTQFTLDVPHSYLRLI